MASSHKVSNDAVHIFTCSSTTGTYLCSQCDNLVPAELKQSEMYQTFQTWAVNNYGDSGKTKTVTRKKFQRIVRVLTGEEQFSAENSKFRFWVKAKGFRLSVNDDGYQRCKHQGGERTLLVPSKHGSAHSLTFRPQIDSQPTLSQSAHTLTVSPHTDSQPTHSQSAHTLTVSPLTHSQPTHSQSAHTLTVSILTQSQPTHSQSAHTLAVSPLTDSQPTHSQTAHTLTVNPHTDSQPTH
ncbi:Nucleolar protein 4 [Bulinus truncatus]|nr:Nucleolar protein 4 [Bulinus truncatus]